MTGTAGVLARRPVRLTWWRGDVDRTDPLVGSVVWARIRFHDGKGAKTRPAVVVAATRRGYVVRPCYSEGGVRSHDARSIRLYDWESAGLAKPGWVSHYETHIRRCDVRSIAGTLSDLDWNSL